MIPEIFYLQFKICQSCIFIIKLENRMDKNFKQLIDARNSHLWKEMRSVYKIKLKEAGEPGYLTSFDNGKVTIMVDMENLNPHSFTHELLHLYMKPREVNVASDLKSAVNKENILNDIFSDSLLEHMGNCLEHVKMLPLYLASGLRNQLFVRDFHKKVMDKKELWELSKSFYIDGIYSRDAIDKFMGEFFFIKTSNNPEFNYDDYFLGLKNIDSQLYASLLKFWEEWLYFELGNAREKYQAMIDRFLGTLKTWKIDKPVL